RTRRTETPHEPGPTRRRPPRPAGTHPLRRPRPGRSPPRILRLPPLRALAPHHLVPRGRPRGPAPGARGGRLREPGAAPAAAHPSPLRPRRRLHHRAVLRDAARPGPPRRDPRGLRGPAAGRGGPRTAGRAAPG